MPDVNVILYRVASALGTTVADLTSDGRSSIESDRRSIACYILSDGYGLSLRDVGTYMSISHPTVSYHLKKVAANEALRDEALQIMEQMHLLEPSVSASAKKEAKQRPLLKQAVQLLKRVQRDIYDARKWPELMTAIGEFLKQVEKPE